MHRSVGICQFKYNGIFVSNEHMTIKTNILIVSMEKTMFESTALKDIWVSKTVSNSFKNVGLNIELSC